MSSKKLEHYKYFTPIALFLCIGFATFVGIIAIKASESIKRLESSNLNLEQKLERLENTINKSST